MNAHADRVYDDSWAEGGNVDYDEELAFETTAEGKMHILLSEFWRLDAQQRLHMLDLLKNVVNVRAQAPQETLVTVTLAPEQPTLEQRVEVLEQKVESLLNKPVVEEKRAERNICGIMKKEGDPLPCMRSFKTKAALYAHRCAAHGVTVIGETAFSGDVKQVVKTKPKNYQPASQRTKLKSSASTSKSSEQTTPSTSTAENPSCTAVTPNDLEQRLSEILKVMAGQILDIMRN